MGTITLSIDAELGWGWHDLPSPPTDRIEAARGGWIHLAALCEEYGIPATWAIVGHLLLEDCDGRHVDHPAGADWFHREATEWRDRPDLRFGGGLVDALLDTSVDHDIGCHSFSHLPFGAPETDRETARAELQSSLDAAADWDLSFDSFVFPRNMLGHRDLLYQYDIETYRGTRPSTRLSSRPVLGRAGKLVRGLAPGTAPPLVEPTVDEYGLVDVPASLYLYGFQGPARTALEAIYEDPIVLKARRGVDAAAENGGVFHMWLHPNNLVSKRDVDRLRAIFSYVDEQRRLGNVDVATMSTVADRVLASH
jgi:peptidoglycan/xylan/chitin deacetylase (PgdA/CDA1 family)